MNDLKEKIGERIQDLREIIQQKEKELLKAPKGVINTACSGNKVQFYYKKSTSDKKKYMKKCDQKLVQALCQKDYDERVIATAKNELKQLEKLQRDYLKESCESIYDKLNVHRKKYVSPIELPDEEFVANWEQVTYVPKTFREDTPEYYTNKGERVRSKSEILIANALEKHGIPYRYECPLYLNGFGTIHPDFTVLNVRLRKEFYWEHMGMMGEPEYLEEALQRINMYEKNNIFPGDKLILSHETSKHPLNPRSIEKLILQYLK